MKSHNLLRVLPIIILIACAVSILFSCANMSRPSGGPKDTTPPRYIKSKPEFNALNYTNNKIEIEFDEIVIVENPSEKVIISPPQLSAPKIQAQGKKVRIELQDTLIPDMTYTIDFSNAIVDNNEKNPLTGFSFSFSTGAQRDSLQVSGILLNAENLEPITGMLVGAYSNLDDTAFTHLPMERIAASDELGHFTIRNLKAGKYRIFALKDANRNYRFDAPTEDIAFYDSIIVPYSEPRQYADTIFTDSLTVDTIVYIDYNTFFPNNILLTAFNEQVKNRYMDSHSRKERNRMDFTFTTAHDSLPAITPLNFEPDSNWYVLEHNLTNDTISYWIRDSLVYNNDTLKIALSYFHTDTLQQLSLTSDTLAMTYKAPKESKQQQKKKKKKEENDSIPEVIPTVFSKMDVSISNSQDVNKPIAIKFASPIEVLERSAFHLSEKRDTLWNDIPDSLYTLLPDSLHPRTYLLSHKWKPEGNYRLTIDSMAAVDMYGLHTDKYKKDIKVKSLQEYSNLYFAITGVADSAIVQLLNSSDKPVVQVPVMNGGAEFTYLKPGTYYARLFIDRNGNGKYDTGNYGRKQQPEEVYYYPGKLELRAYWNIEQSWDIYGKPIDQQKHYDIKKNKPKDKKPKKDEEEKNDSYNSPYGNSNSPYGASNSPYGSAATRRN